MTNKWNRIYWLVLWQTDLSRFGCEDWEIRKNGTWEGVHYLKLS